ncbi:MAG: cytochrome c3 family protein [Phycisphaerae bacterium]|nr:cytochrome c3 family protein [Phycisphaerae bacterium]
MAAHSDDVGCGACHVPHKALKPDATSYGVPLWNPAVNSDAALPTFTLYSSPYFDAVVGTGGITQPDGPSKLCLGCHDGTYAGITASHSFGTGGEMTLAQSHPISFVYNTALSTSPNLHVPGEFKDPHTADSGLGGTIEATMLDANSKMQCTSCHDVHTSGIGVYQLKKDYTDGKSLCQTCHNK